MTRLLEIIFRTSNFFEESSSFNIPYGDMAVFYRNPCPIEALEEELVKNNISYRIFWWHFEFYERKEIKRYTGIPANSYQ